MASADTPDKPARFFRRRTFVVPTWRVAVPSLVLIAALAFFVVKNTYGWLAISEPIENAPCLIVEGWLPDYALQTSAERAKQSDISKVFCTGIPIDRGTLVYSYGNYARYASETLGRMGVPVEKITQVSAPLSRTERSRTMARALRVHLDSTDIPAADRRINLITLGTHARRSRNVFQDGLGESWQVGVVSVPDQESDPDRWFLQSNAAKNVISELIALTLGVFGAN